MSASPAAARRDEAHRDLWTRTAEVAGRLNRVQGELVDLAARVIEGEHWGDGGFRSPEHYFVVRAGLSPAHARDVVAVAKRRHELTEAAAALREGTLSLDQTAVVAHHAPTSHQRSATEFARHATVPQLRRALGRHAFTVLPAGASPAAGADNDSSSGSSGAPASVGGATGPAPALGLPERSESERRACARPELSMHYDHDGRLQLRYSAPAPIGALVEQALKEAKDALFLAASGSGPEVTTGLADRDARASSTSAPPPAHFVGPDRPTYGEALAELAQRSLASVASTARASHYRVYLHLSTDGAWVNAAGAIPRRLVDRFVSDGVVQPVWETEGRPISVGRSMRILPRRSRRLIEDRDRGCRFPGCTATRFVEVHHLHEWAGGGATDVDNQVSLCPFHHDAIDRGDYRICGDPTRPDGLLVTNRHGLRVRPPTAAELGAPPGGDPPEPPTVEAYRPPSGESARWSDIEILPDDPAVPAAQGHPHRPLHSVTPVDVAAAGCGTKAGADTDTGTGNRDDAPWTPVDPDELLVPKLYRTWDD